MMFCSVEVGLLHAGASSASVITALVWLHKVNSSLIWVIFTVIPSIWQLNGNRVQIPKLRSVKTGAVRYPVQ